MTLPPDTPYWLAVLALFLGWVGKSVWPVVSSAWSQRVGTETDLKRAKVEAALDINERQVAAQEAQVEVDRKIAEGMFKLADQVAFNTQANQQHTQAVTSLSTAFSVQIGQMPTNKQFTDMVERMAKIEAILAVRYPEFDRRKPNVTLEDVP